MAIMAKKKSAAYYYAGGKRVALETATDLVAVDDARLAAQLPDLLASDDALQAGQSLRGGIRLIHTKALAAGTFDALKRTGVTQPVFRQDGTILIALPEIRVEDESEAKLDKVRKFAANQVEPIAEGAEGRMTLQPLSAKGEDAMHLANTLIEQYELTSATPRFLRIVPNPDVAPQPTRHG